MTKLFLASILVLIFIGIKTKSSLLEESQKARGIMTPEINIATKRLNALVKSDCATANKQKDYNQGTTK